MSYIYEGSKPRRRMHLQRYQSDGTPLLAALCGIRLPFNRSINEPWGLGRKVCRKCLKVRKEEE